MKKLLFLALACTLHATSYYVASASSTPAGNDANPGTIGAPWLTYAHAVANVSTGDTINIVADGNKVTCDATLPANVTNITTQSTKLAMLPAVGFRVNPATDSANFGKCQLASTGIVAQGEVHGFNQGAAFQTFTVASSTFTLTSSNSFASNGYTFQNGSIVDFEINNELNGDVPPPSSVAVPSPLTILTHYYVVNCSVSPACGAQNSTFQVAATSGGSPITITACDSNCAAYGEIGLPIQVDASTDVITSPDALGSAFANGDTVTFASGGLQLGGNLPAPLAQDTPYYIINKSGNTFKLSLTMGGSAINLTNTGTGMVSVSNTAVPHGWKFSGIEFAPTSGTFLFSVIVVGNGSETSPLSMVDHMEFDRIWCHDFSNAQNGPRRCFAENSTNFSLHDSYISGMKDTNNDAQAIGGWCSYGPTTIVNTFFEASGENALYGGSWPTYYPCTNQNKTITGNYFYKPFLWKYITGVGAPSGTCLYDTGSSPDPDHRGGEFYLDTMASQGYVCSSGSWTTTGSTPNHYGVKNLLEFKSARNWTVSGNVFEGSWVDQQSGAVLFNQREGSGPGIANDHITFTNNKITNVYALIGGGSACTGVGTGVLPCLVLNNTHTFTNNLGVSGGKPYCGVPSIPSTCGSGLNINGWGGYPASNDTWSKNTIIAPDGISGTPFYPTSWYFSDTIPSAGAVKNNAMLLQNSILSYDLSGATDLSGTTCGSGMFGLIFSNSTFNRHALIGGSSGCAYGSSPGAGNTMTNTQLPANTAAVGFVNTSIGDYHLASTSPYSAANATPTLLSTDGTDLGADIDALNAAISGAVVGTPTWAVQESFNVTPLATGATITYTRPGTTACSLTVYNAPARITANENADTNTSGKKLDTRTGNTVVGENVTFNVGFNTPLSPVTQYWYSLSCVAADMSTWLLAGDSFTTLPSVVSGGALVGGKVSLGGKFVIH